MTDQRAREAGLEFKVQTVKRMPDCCVCSKPLIVGAGNVIECDNIEDVSTWRHPECTLSDLGSEE